MVHVPPTEVAPVRRLLLTIGIAALTLAGCGDVEEAVQDGISQASEVAAQAREQIEDTSRNVQFCSAALSTAKAVEQQNWESAIEAGENLVEQAPDEIAEDAQTLLDGARAYQEGDQSVVQTDEFREAAERVEAYTRETCDPRS